MLWAPLQPPSPRRSQPPPTVVLAFPLQLHESVLDVEFEILAVIAFNLVSLL